MFLKTTVFIINHMGKLERRDGEVPAIIGCPPLKVTAPADANGHDVVRMLRRLADESEEQSA
jgi:hypothetical protein